MKRFTLIGWGVIALMCCLVLVLPVGAVSNGKIAFDSNYPISTSVNIYSIYPDGTGLTDLTNNPVHVGSSNPAWSPDGTKIAFAYSSPTSDIYVMNRDGSGKMDLTNLPGKNDIDPTWSPDGMKIAFSSWRDGLPLIYVMNAIDGSDQHRLMTQTSGGGDTEPAWSPDGMQIAFSRDGKIYVVNADGTGDQIPLTSGPYDHNPAWSPDGNQIVFDSGIYQYPEHSFIYVMNKDGSYPIQLTEDRPEDPVTHQQYWSNDRYPVWSPDGTKIAYNKGQAIYIMNSYGSDQNRVPGYTGLRPTWAIYVPPVADAGPDQTVYVDDSMTFDGSHSYDPSDIVSYVWTFGDTTSGSGVSATHIYTAVGVYTATLTITDKGGLTSSDTAAINVISPVTITYPNGGEKFITGYSGGFAWASTNVNDRLQVTLMRGDKAIKDWPETQPSGEETFIVRPEWGNGDNYKVCIKDLVHPEFQDCSDGPFTIAEGPIKVIAPNGGEYWPPRSTHTINWRLNVCPKTPIPAPVPYCLPEGSTVNVRVWKGDSTNVVRDLGDYDFTDQILWTVDVPAGTDYKVQITSKANPDLSDISDWWFYVKDAPPCFKNPVNGKTICADLSFIDLSAIARGSSCPPNCPIVDISKIHFSATGAVNIPLTTVAGDAAFPMIDKHGLTTITYYTEDSFGHMGTLQTFEILIDQTPDLTNPGDKSVSEGKTLQINLIASDKDGGPLTYSFTSTKTLPGAVISVNSFTWTPGSGSAGTYSVTFKATDSWGLSDEETIKIIVNVPTNVKIVPKTINIGSKGHFLTFVTLPEAYKGATIDMKSVSCSGAPAVRMMKLKIFPRMVGFVFKTSELKNVQLGNKVTLNVKGELKNNGKTYTFTGADSIKVISKPTWQPDDIKDVSKESDDQLFKKFNT